MHRVLFRRFSWGASGAVALGLVLSSCTGASGPGGAETLAKAGGWDAQLEEPLVGEGSAYGVLEIAYDEDSFEALWEAGAPADLHGRRGSPDEPGVYGTLDEVDPADQVLALWSGGESGSCPEWVDAVGLDGDLVVVSTTTGGSLFGSQACTSDYASYRSVLVIERKDVPSRAELADAEAVVRSAGMDGGGSVVRLADFAGR